MLVTIEVLFYRAVYRRGAAFFSGPVEVQSMAKTPEKTLADCAEQATDAGEPAVHAVRCASWSRGAGHTFTESLRGIPWIWMDLDHLTYLVFD